MSSWSWALALALVCFGDSAVEEQRARNARVFDTHWKRLERDYAYFELYGVDWDAERERHRPLAVAAPDELAFTRAMTRLLCALPDPHVSFLPPLQRFADEGRGWSLPELKLARLDDTTYVLAWPTGQEPETPARWADDPHGYPQITSVDGTASCGVGVMLAAGPTGTEFELGLRWPDGTESAQRLRRPEASNMPWPTKAFGEHWLVSGRVGEIGYLRVRSFAPKRTPFEDATPMVAALHAALDELSDARALILDLRENGGGQVQASDPFLGRFLDRKRSYRWGGRRTRKRVIAPVRPRYRGELVVLVDEGSASGAEWAARILRDAERALVVGGPTVGAEAAVLRSEAEDGSVVSFSGWGLKEPGKRAFQEVGVQLDHALPLTIADVRELGYGEAKAAITRARFAKALELLDAAELDVDAFLALADDGRAVEDG